MNKKNEVKDNLEAGMYFKFKENSRYSVHRNKVYKLSIEDTTTQLISYYTLSNGSLFFQASVIIRRVGETSMDYYDFDMFSKKTRGRLYYKEIDSFFYVKTDAEGNEYTTIEKPKDPSYSNWSQPAKKKLEIEKCPVPGIAAIGV
tara:strand:- start:143 stop:577 length:435 start_codon:yes stop_codon:yes gene_type:complete